MFHLSVDIRPVDSLNQVEQELDNDGEIEGGEDILRRRRKGDTRSLAKKLSKDINQLKKEKEEYSV